MIEVFSYGFMQKAFVTGMVTAVACSLLGVFLVLRRYALIGDGLSHIAFGGVATGLLFNINPFAGAFIFALIGALGILRLKEKTMIHADTAIGIISYASLGIGIFIVSISQGFNVDLLSYLFGSILAINTSDVLISIALASTVIAVIALSYEDLFYMAFDEESAKASGIKTEALNALLIILTAITIVSSMRVVGLMLASSLLVLPPASALQYNTSFKKTLLLSAAISLLSVFFGLILAYYYDFAVSGTIVLLNTVLFLLSVLAGRFRGKEKQTC